jgi:hypothetical protein
MIVPINQHDPQGRPHGVWKHYWESYWPDSILWWRAHWLHGKRHGHWESYRSGVTSYCKRYYLNIK